MESSVAKSLSLNRKSMRVAVVKERCWTIPTNTGGGLVGYGHPVGASGVRQAVDLYLQLTGKAGDHQVTIPGGRPYGMMVSMGGNDITVVSMVFKQTS